MSTIPLETTYWAVPDRLMGGAYPHQEADVNALLKEGITCFINLTEEKELPPYHHQLPEGVTHHRLSIIDFTVPSQERMKEILDCIDAAQEGGKVYVHCYGGKGRTGTVVACYLKRHGCADPLAELTKLFHASLRCQKQKLEPGGIQIHSPETEEQREYVKQWKE